MGTPVFLFFLFFLFFSFACVPVWGIWKLDCGFHVAILKNSAQNGPFDKKTLSLQFVLALSMYIMTINNE